MLLMTVKYFIQEGHRDEVLAGLREMKDLVTASEPGCLLYQVWESRDEPNVFLLQEQYVDEDALKAHRETPHFKDILEARVIPLLKDRVREFYDPLIS
jgi:autoinducer 2-degrading protein